MEVAEDKVDAIPTKAEITAIRVNIIHLHLRTRTLSIKGKRSELVQRLIDVICDSVPYVQDFAIEVIDNMGGEGFCPTSHWVLPPPSKDDSIEEESKF